MNEVTLFLDANTLTTMINIIGIKDIQLVKKMI